MKKKESRQMKIAPVISKLLLIFMIIAMIPFLWQCNEENSSKMLQSNTSTKIYDIREVHERPEIIKAGEVKYPESAKDKGIEGFLQIAIVINEYGNVEEAEIFKSIPGLDAAALEAAKAYQFKPAKIDGVPVAVRWQIPFTFDLDFVDIEAAHKANLYKFYESDVKPKMIHKEQPVYPEEARKQEIAGMAVVTITIDEQGGVEKAKIYISAHPLLDEAAINAAKKCKFNPGHLNGKPVKIKMNVPFKFNLK
jgi:TonB family protein